MVGTSSFALCLWAGSDSIDSHALTRQLLVASSGNVENPDNDICHQFEMMYPDIIIEDDGAEVFVYPNITFEQEFEVRADCCAMQPQCGLSWT